MNQYLRDAQGISDQAGMLPPGAAKRHQRVLAHIVAALNRDFLDGIGQVGDGDLDKALGNLVRTALLSGGLLDFLAQGGEFLLYGSHIQRLIPLGATDFGEKIWMYLAHHLLAVRHSQRHTISMGGRTGIAPRRLRPDPHAGPVERTNRARTSSDS